MKTNLAIIFVVGVLIGGILGFYVGDRAGRDALQPVLNIAYPPPPKEMKSLAGKIKSVSSGGFVLEIPDPEDYLPHADGSVRRTDLRTALVTPETKISYVNSAGEERSLEFTSVAKGHRVRVESASNIRSLKTFAVLSVRVLSGEGFSGSVGLGEKQAPRSALAPEVLNQLFGPGASPGGVR